MKRYLLILLVIGLSLTSCSQGFSPGPKGDIGPQGDVGPQGNVGPQGDIGPSSIEGPSSENAIHIEDTSVLVEEEFPLRGFSEIEISDFFDAEIRQGETYRVMVEAEEALTPYLDIVVLGKTLQIGLKSDYTYNFENASQRVELTLPAIARAQVSNHSMLYLLDFEVDDTLTLEVTDFSTLSGAINASDIQVEVSNHSSLNLTGSASQVTGEVMNFSSADLTGLVTVGLDIDTDAHSTLMQ